ncbi:hypothetical protein BST33_00120 [Mycolicibacter minnesotensis]|uniref:LtfC/p132/Gp6 beta-sandwich domain-containing protein n=1 Tax=Mycolicibacter minnesotensis TaxID=1118379 RepID=A0A7I7R8I6_9MYCO|nr:hypothetical protein [Mycolicibacter minnesotensis]ORB04350.1 hypothetical protein BST33_00120 [Mycolicibacter minnesotensis]BBY34921.1 hypothetical protein MMIN_29820 [Mycolicibacter minnesotensis]
MSVIGVELDGDQLVLTRRRDFKWTFENVTQDDNQDPIPFPPGDLFFELETGGQHNALQEVRVEAADGGTYKLGVFDEMTGPIDYYDATENPRGMAGDITTALEALLTVGAGNVKVHPAKLYPVWEIKLKLDTGHNEIQLIQFTGNVTGGHFKLSYGLAFTDKIAYGSSAEVVKQKLEALAGIGTGNVKVDKISDGYQVEFINTKAQTDVQQLIGYSVGYFLDFFLTGTNWPGIKTSTLVPGSAKFNEKTVNVLNKTVNDFFNSFEELLGVDLDYEVHDNLNTTIKATSLRSFVESDLITFALDVTGSAIEGFLNSVSALVGLFDTIQVNFYWNHIYQVEFIGDLAETPVPKMTTDTSLLTGDTNEQKVEVDVLKPGRQPLTVWQFDIDGTEASLKIESDEADKIVDRTDWQLVFLPDGEAKGGDPIALGRVRVQGER